MTTDTQLKESVLAELLWEPAVCSSDIAVTVQDGVVTLSGSVPHFAEKRVAELATRRVQGVKVIAEELDVNLTGIHRRNDVEIAAAVANSLKWHVWVPNDVQATVEKGWVRLTGTVSREFQRNAAESAVSYLSGVIGVSNEIALTPSVQATAIKDAIEKALTRDAEIDARNIFVSANAGDVILTGNISSWHQRDEAGMAAWSAPGVTSVENKLVVSA